MTKIKSILRHWLPLAVVIIGLSGLVYLAVQQDIRVGYGNQPQVQMAEDAASALAGGASASSLMPAAQVDIASSLAPFLIIYDNSGKVIASSALLHGQNPELPSGILDYVKLHGEDRVTWSPEPPDVRIAAVVVSVSGGNKGYVLAGRSMRELEKSENLVELQAFAAMFVTLVISLGVVILVEFIFPPG